VQRLRGAVVPIVQSALAAGLAWLVATDLVGHSRPFFAPIAAIIVLGVNPGRRWRRALEIWLGVALGILVADLLIAGIGTGPLQLALTVSLAMAAAVLVGGGPLLVNQAAASAVLISTLQPAGGGGINGQRFVDALIGGGIGILVHALVLPIDPVATVRRAMEPLIDELAGTIDDIAAALRDRDLEGANRALARARAVAGRQAQLREALEAADETARISPGRWTARAPLAEYATTVTHLDLAIRDVRVLARGVIRAIELEAPVPPEVIAAIGDLATAVRGLVPELRGEEVRTRAAALRAAGLATLALEQTANLSVSVIVGQVRSTAVDLLRGMGVEGADARRMVREAAQAVAAERGG
jgi:uncharacterized membrane protein YgaE (UPF0421/DUF939 family)